jgi:phosphatidate cytidylyltransferase
VTRVLSGAVLLAVAISVVWLAPPALFVAAAFVLLFGAVMEFVGLAHASGLAVARWPAVAAALLTLAALSVGGGAGTGTATPLQIVLLAEFIALGGVSLSYWRGGSDAIATVAASVFPSLYLALPIGALVAIREAEGPATLFLLMLTVSASDTAQYYTGRLLGRRPLAPAISPKKTTEGALGGFVFGALVLAFAGAWWLPRVPLAFRALLGVTVVALGITGDLFESMLKRSAGVKDSSGLIPGHGGVLDRIDALLFAAPVYYIVLQYV